MIYIITNYTPLFDEGIYKNSTLEHLESWLIGKKLLGLDTETTGLDFLKDSLFLIQLGDYEDQWVIDVREGISPKLKEILEGDFTFVLQNAKFDLKFLFQLGILLKNSVCDTFLAERILTNDGNPSTRRGYDSLVKKYLGIELKKGIRKGIHKLGLTEAVIKYSADDVKYLLPVLEFQSYRAKNQDLLEAFKLDFEFVTVLSYIEFCGIKLDEKAWRSKVTEDYKDFNEKKQALDSWIITEGFNKYISNQLDIFNPEPVITIQWSSPAQVIPLLQDLGVDTSIEDKETGGIKDSVDASVLEKQINVSPFVPIYLKYKKAEKVVSTYGENWFSYIEPSTGRIHTQFTQLMDTGRLSSGKKDRAAKKEYPNLQNIPSNPITRACFKVDVGNKLLVADYSGQEQIILVNFSLDKDLLKFYDEGMGDMHSYIAAKIFPELEEVSLDEIKNNHKDKRQIAKGAGFAINYGGQGKTISDNLNISEAEGDEIYNAYFQAFPGLKSYFLRLQKEALRLGYVIFNDITKRKYTFNFFEEFQSLKKEINSEFWEEYRVEKAADSLKFQTNLKPKVKRYFNLKGTIERTALNFPIQGSAADMTKIAGNKLYKHIIENGDFGKVKIVNMVHDEILVESPEGKSEEYSILLKKYMEEAAEYFCKRVKCKADPGITNFWVK